MSCPHIYSDAAYVLGALSPAERAEYEAHLAGCAECAGAVAKLAPMPGLLSRVDPAALAPAPPGPGRLSQLLEQVTSYRRRQTRARRWQLAAATVAAAVVAVTGTVVGVQVAGPGPVEPAPAPVAMQPVGAVAPVEAEVALAPAPGGTQVWMSCWYPPTAYQTEARTFRLVAVATDGTVEQLGSWSAGSGERVSLTGLTRFTDDLARLELHSGTGIPLLSHQPG